MVARNLEEMGVAAVNLPAALRKWDPNEHPAHCLRDIPFFGNETTNEKTWFDWAATGGEGRRDLERCWRVEEEGGRIRDSDPVLRGACAPVTPARSCVT
jgi:hypothetical protein